MMIDLHPAVLRLRAASAFRAIRRHAPSAAHRRWIGVAVLVLLVLVVVVRVDLTRLEQTFLRADWRGAVVALALLLLSLVVRSVALKLIVDAFGPARARLRDVLSATSIGLLANCLIPLRVGNLLAPYVLFVLLRRRHAAIPFPTVLGMSLTERLFAIASFVVLSLLFVATQSAPSWVAPVLFVAAAGTAILLMGCVVLERHRRRVESGGREEGGEDRDRPRRHPGGAGAAPPRGGRAARVAAALRQAIPEIADSQRIMGQPLRAALVAGVQALALLLQVAAAYAGFQAFHLEGAGLPAVALLIVLTNLIGLIPLTPGNLGTFQVAAVAALAIHGVPAAPAMAFAVGLQTMELAVAVVAGLVSLSVQDLRLADLRNQTSHLAVPRYGTEPAAAPSAD
jgi:uncharacterized protein (TIRG00374 family)